MNVHCSPFRGLAIFQSAAEYMPLNLKSVLIRPCRGRVVFAYLVSVNAAALLFQWSHSISVISRICRRAEQAAVPTSCLQASVSSPASAFYKFNIMCWPEGPFQPVYSCKDESTQQSCKPQECSLSLVRDVQPFTVVLVVVVVEAFVPTECQRQS